jgi:hypothetical protein
MSDRFSAAHFTPPGEIVRMTPTALGGILTIAGFGVIVILAIQLVINYFSESTNKLISLKINFYAKIICLESKKNFL